MGIARHAIKTGLGALAALLLLALVLGGLAGALHQHRDATLHPSCAVCVAGHAPALASASVHAPARPGPTRTHPAAPPASGPCLVARTPSLSRAPPLA